jgi:phosphatidylinositol kinase/protein kinase (PI-3  family)
MDFATAANSLFAASAASRRRGLRLRTYYVAVLTEDCGILQVCSLSSLFSPLLISRWFRTDAAA